MDVGILVFGDRIRISRLASVYQANRNPRLICNSSAAPDDITPAVNASAEKSTAPDAIQFGACLPRFLQKICEADSSDGPVWLSKWDISDAFHRCLLLPGDIGSFTYVVPPLPTYISTLLCIDLVIPKGWVNSPYMLCASSETVSDVDNGYLLGPTSTFKIYPPTEGTYSLDPSLTASAARLQYVDFYMDGLNCATHVDVGKQQQTSKLTIRSLKEIFPPLPYEVKDSVSLKKALQGDGDWAQVKEILVWIIITQDGTLRLPPKRLAELSYYYESVILVIHTHKSTHQLLSHMILT